MSPSGPVLLIHGSFHTGECWARLTPILEQSGMASTVLTLPGQAGGPAMKPWRVSMMRYGEAIAAEAERLGGNVTIVGHSMGGLGISQAAELRPDLFRRMIYVSAVVPRPGRFSMMSSVKLGPALKKFPSLHRNGTITVTPEVARTAFYNRTDTATQDWAIERLSPQPLSTSWSPVHVTEDRLGRIEKHYVACTSDNALPLATQQEMQANQSFHSITNIESDHSPFLSAPDDLAVILESLVRK